MENPFQKQIAYGSGDGDSVSFLQTGAQAKLISSLARGKKAKERLDHEVLPKDASIVKDIIIRFNEWLPEGAGQGSKNIASPDVNELYLSTLRDTLTGTSLKSPSVTPGTEAATKPFDETLRNLGADWCSSCYTMS